MADRNSDPYIGRQFEGRYEILNLLGRGGMGSVYRAIDRNLQREVAVKLLREDFASRPDLRQRFLQEAELAAQLEHPGIVPVYHVNGDGNLLYIVMELVPGGNLAELMTGMRQKRKWITLYEALQIVRQIAIALQYAHDRNILHRDIKPANIMLRNRAAAGLDYQPVVTDLGLAKVIDQNSSMQPLMGTPSYMSPEQVLAQDLDGRSDIYSLGLLLYELLVGKLPFQITSFPEALKYHVNEPIRPPRNLRPDLPQSVEDVVLRAVAKNLDERFATAAEFAASIDALGSVNLNSPPPQAQSTVGLATIWQLSIIDQLDRPVLPSVVQMSQIQGPSLQVRQPDGQFLTIGLKPKMTIGREQGTDIVLEDTQVSRNHALLRQQGSQYTITDLESTNGTFLNGQRLIVKRAYPLTQRDDLRIGNHRLRLLLGKDEIIEGQAFSALLLESSVQGVAGETVRIPLQVTNQQEGSVNIDVSVVGIDHNWVRPFRPVEIPGNQEKRIALTLSLPSDSATNGGRFNLLLRTVDRISGYEQTLETPLQIAAPGSVIVPPPPPLPPIDLVEPPQKKPMPWLVYLLAGVLLIFVAAGVGYALTRESNGGQTGAVALQTGTPPPGEGDPTATSAGGSVSVTVAIPVDTATPTPTETDTPPPPSATTALTATATDTPSPIPSETHTATVVPSDTPAPTATAIKPTATSAPLITGPTDTPTPLVIGGTATQTPTRSAVPTSTRRPATSTPTLAPTRAPTPIPIPVTPAPAGQLDGFESIAWSSNNSSWGTLTSTTEQVHDGSSAAKLAYTIPGADAGNNFVILSRNIPIAGTPSQFTLWVYSNGSNHFLNILATDNAGLNFQFSFGRINHQGWQQMTAQVDPNLAWPNQRLPTKADNTPLPQYPIRVTGIVLDPHPDGQNVNGTIYLDDLRSN